MDGTLNNPNDTDIGYTVEIAIPWQELGQSGPPKDGTTWGFNVISRDRDSTDAPAARFFSLSPQVQSAADVQDPSKWSHITFTTGDVPPSPRIKSSARTRPWTASRTSTAPSSAASGRASSRLSFGTAAIDAPAPTVAEEPNTTNSAFSTPQPVQPTPANPPISPTGACPGRAEAAPDRRGAADVH